MLHIQHDILTELCQWCSFTWLHCYMSSTIYSQSRVTHALLPDFTVTCPAWYTHRAVLLMLCYLTSLLNVQHDILTEPCYWCSVTWPHCYMSSTIYSQIHVTDAVTWPHCYMSSMIYSQSHVTDSQLPDFTVTCPVWNTCTHRIMKDEICWQYIMPYRWFVNPKVQILTKQNYLSGRRNTWYTSSRRRFSAVNTSWSTEAQEVPVSSSSGPSITLTTGQTSL